MQRTALRHPGRGSGGQGAAAGGDDGAGSQPCHACEALRSVRVHCSSPLPSVPPCSSQLPKHFPLQPAPLTLALAAGGWLPREGLATWRHVGAHTVDHALVGVAVKLHSTINQRKNEGVVGTEEEEEIRSVAVCRPCTCRGSRQTAMNNKQ